MRKRTYVGSAPCSSGSVEFIELPDTRSLVRSIEEGAPRAQGALPTDLPHKATGLVPYQTAVIREVVD